MKRVKPQREQASGKADLGWLFPVVASVIGMIGGLVVGVLKHRSLILMQAGGVAGLSVGGLAMWAWSWWLKHQTPKPPVPIQPTTRRGSHRN